MELLAVERLDVVEGVAGVVDEGVLGEVAAVPPDLGAEIADGGVDVVASEGGLEGRERVLWAEFYVVM